MQHRVATELGIEVAGRISLKYSDSTIADMLIHSFLGTEAIANKIESEWEPIKEGMTLQECLDDALHVYAMTIDNEIGFSRERKLLALKIEVACRIRIRQ